MQTLRVFCDVARHQSFSRAAAEHGITQSAASQRIGQLEKRLGVTLVDRSVRPLEMTPAGRVFFEGCQDLLERHDRLTQRVARMGGVGQAVVRVDAIYSAGIDLLSCVKEAFEPAHPNVRVVIEYKHPDEVYEAVRDRRCDLGILSYPCRWRDVRVIPLRDEPMAVICAPQHALAGARRLHASQLGQWSMASFEPSLPVGRQVKQYLKEHEVAPSIVSVFDNIDTIKSAVAVTDQIAIVPRRTALREAKAGTLTVIELEPQLVRPMGIIYRGYHGHNGANGYRKNGKNGHGKHDPELAQPVQWFVDCLLQYAGPDEHDADHAHALAPTTVPAHAEAGL